MLDGASDSTSPILTWLFSWKWFWLWELHPWMEKRGGGATGSPEKEGKRRKIRFLYLFRFDVIDLKRASRDWLRDVSQSHLILIGDLLEARVQTHIQYSRQLHDHKSNHIQVEALSVTKRVQRLLVGVGLQFVINFCFENWYEHDESA